MAAIIVISLVLFAGAAVAVAIGCTFALLLAARVALDSRKLFKGE